MFPRSIIHRTQIRTLKAASNVYSQHLMPLLYGSVSGKDELNPALLLASRARYFACSGLQAVSRKKNVQESHKIN